VGLRLLGEIAAHQDSPEIEPAAHHYRQVLALAEEFGMCQLVARMVKIFERVFSAPFLF
jgi:hypothetical protein